MWGAMPGIWGCSVPGTHNYLRPYPSQRACGAGEAELGRAALPGSQTRAQALAL